MKGVMSVGFMINSEPLCGHIEYSMRVTTLFGWLLPLHILREAEHTVEKLSHISQLIYIGGKTKRKAAH
jgi:hypothetical protein